MQITCSGIYSHYMRLIAIGYEYVLSPFSDEGGLTNSNTTSRESSHFSETLFSL